MAAPGPWELAACLNSAELLDVVLSHAQPLPAYTLIRVAGCNKQFQGIVKLHIQVRDRSGSAAQQLASSQQGTCTLSGKLQAPQGMLGP
jgi:hypothetical protein